MQYNNLRNKGDFPVFKSTENSGRKFAPNNLTSKCQRDIHTASLLTSLSGAKGSRDPCFLLGNEASCLLAGQLENFLYGLFNNTAGTTLSPYSELPRPWKSAQGVAVLWLGSPGTWG